MNRNKSTVVSYALAAIAGIFFVQGKVVSNYIFDRNRGAR